MLKVLQQSNLSLFNTDAETLTMMWQTVLLGMGMVFTVLAILWLILSIFKVVFAGKEPKQEKPVKVQKEEKKAEPPVQAAPQVATVATQSNDELIAVLTAAVAAYRAQEGSEAYDGSFRVVSFTRIKGGRSWNSK